MSRELDAAARCAGATVVTGADVQRVAADDAAAEVGWVDAGGTEHTVGARYVLANVAPQTLDRLRGRTPAPAEGNQLKVNMVLRRLPRLRSGVDPQAAFAGTFHIDQGYGQLADAYEAASGGQLPVPVPSEIAHRPVHPGRRPGRRGLAHAHHVRAAHAGAAVRR